MNDKPSILKRYNKLFISLAIIIILTLFRVAWILFFTMHDGPSAVGGELDLRNIPLEMNETITLDGEWEFHPHVFLMDDIHLSENKHLLHVPGSWNSLLSPDGDTSYGYGSYRLRIFVPPSKDMNYSIRVPSVRSSSALFVNGKQLAFSGQPAKEKANYLAENVPYTATFSADNLEEIELVIHVANYADTRGSGIIRSMKFGSQQAIHKETQLSVTLQLFIVIAFFIHALYALILYFMGTRDKRLLYFALFILSISIFFSLANDDKILLSFLPISYDWSFKLTHLVTIVAAVSLVYALKDGFPSFWRTKIVPVFTVLSSFAFIGTFLLSAEDTTLLNLMYAFIGGFAFFSTIIILIIHSSDILKGHYLILISMLAVTNHFIWGDIFRATGIKTVYYPFDLIIALVSFTMIWFQQYFKNLKKTEQLAARLQESNELKDQFLANTSHELRNPLHGIINMTEAVIDKERPTLNEQTLKNLENVVLTGRRMSYMLNDLLDVMHLKEKNIAIHKSSVNVLSTVSGTIHMLQHMTEGKPLEFICDIPEDFPLVQADGTRLTQILFNLLHNAVKYTLEGTIRVSATVKDGKAHISIEDTGIGIDEQLLKRIFKPYEQASFNETGIDGGFGLGLNISQQLVHLHGSNLTVRSTVGQGSTFRFSLDLAETPNVSPEISTQEETSPFYKEEVVAVESADLMPPPKQLPRFRPRILAVDDDPFNLDVLKNILPAQVYEVVTVTSAEQALALVEEERWHLVISDIMMPNISGYEFTRTIRKQFSLIELPVILLTALSHPLETEQGFLAGANDFVTKPVDGTVLRARVKALTDLQLSLNERLRMEIALLQAQIQPHFLFNTLNSIAALSQIDTERMLRLLDEFSLYLRASFDFKNLEHLVPIKNELDLVRSYLYIEKERFGKRLTTRIEIDDGLKVLIPPLTIQPLVENAVKHGILKKQDGGTVIVKVTEDEDHYVVSVTDDGVGMPKEQLAELTSSDYRTSERIGLANTHERLVKTLGSRLEMTSTLGEGTTVSFKIAKERSD